MTDPATTNTTGLHIGRGLVLTVVLGPVMVVGAAVAAVALIQFFIAGWTPLDWATNPTEPGTWLDWAFGPSSGAAARFIVFMAGGMTATLAWSGIAWGFTDRNPLD